MMEKVPKPLPCGQFEFIIHPLKLIALSFHIYAYIFKDMSLPRMSLLHLFKKIGSRVQLSSCECLLIVCCFDFSSVLTFTTLIMSSYWKSLWHLVASSLVASPFLCLLKKLLFCNYALVNKLFVEQLW